MRTPDEQRGPAIFDDARLESALLGSARLAVLRMGPDRVLTCSPAARALLGAGELSGLQVGDGELATPDGRRYELDLHPLPGNTGWLGVVGAQAGRVTSPTATALELKARFDDSPVAQARAGLDGRVLDVNAALEALLGRTRDELRGSDALRLFVEGDRRRIARALAGVVGGGPVPPTQERTIVRRDGSEVPVALTAALVADDEGRPVLACSVQDLTPQRVAEQALSAGESRLRALLRYATDVVVVVDGRGNMTYVSPAITERFGYAEEVVRHSRALSLNHPDDVPAIVRAFERVRAEPGAVEVFECRVRHADGTWRWTEQRYTNLLDDPVVAGVVVNLRDTTERRLAEHDLRRLAVHDSLTGLPNRTLLLDRVEQALQRSRHSGEQAGLVLLDVVGMRGHNDRLGHHGGDALLIVVAERLQAAVGPHASVARVGQDAFAVLVEHLSSAEELRSRATALLAAAEEPLRVGSHDVTVALRAGVALTPADSAGGLLAAAERVVRRRRLPGGPAVLQGTTEAVEAADELERGLESGELRLHYQPVLRLCDGQVEGVEALVRWQHPVRGLLPPAAFVPLAEESGLVVGLGEWVLRTACESLARWSSAGRALTVGVNLSPRQLAVPGFGDLVRGVLTQTGVRPDQLVLEVTESALIDDAGALETLRGLHELGVRLALDDFGTGYSSLTYLKLFPVHALKVDRSFVSGLGRDRDDEAIVASVVSLARSVGRAVVAEGVETEGQLRRLRQLGVDQAQGFLWSPALPADELERWLDAHSPSAATGSPSTAAPAAVRLPDGVQDRILALQAEGASLQTIAAALNGEGLRSPSGNRWHSRSVARVVAALPARPERRPPLVSGPLPD